MFTIHVVDGFIETLYLAVYEEKVLLIDSGCRSDVPRIEQVMKRRLKRPMSQLKLAVASHPHPDHAGGAHTLRSRHGVPVAAPYEINRWYAGFSGGLQHKIDTLLGYVVARAMKYPFEWIWYKKHLTFDHPLKDGDRLPGFEDWQVIATPGHTAHDVVLYHAHSKTLYAADVILKVGSSFRPPFPVSMRPEMRQSIEKLRNLEVNHLLLAHGGAIQTDNFPAILDIMLKEIDKGVPPGLKRLKKLEGFSPVMKQYNKKKE
ncbi:MBL fold metallo-hydrolase [Desulfoluna butyratoxydans]|uniref:Metallo-beta-lactamase n=1 Tax=Desulfoluna butyratoxydans TaxID=231438 RepID=A0A4U8YTI1_9BACT|nr:MBL fold metallo-hydrolase [Desulfoluna butyratoxydans]VFQ47261.1 metallo-beta-lactamase [Desulfoluna butyratoxydans]